MLYIDRLLLQLDADTLDNIPAVRTQIVDLILQSLDCRRMSLDEWEKLHFANALGSLGLNVNSLHQPTKAWLRLCLADLKRALMPVAQRPNGFAVDGAKIEGLNWAQLMEALTLIQSRIEQPVCLDADTPQIASFPKMQFAARTG